MTSTSPASSHDTLTLADLERMCDRLKTPAERIREAKEVSVHASAHVAAGMTYLLKPPSLLPSDVAPEPPLMVICRPESLDAVKAVVAEIRAVRPPVTETRRET